MHDFNPIHSLGRLIGRQKKPPTPKGRRLGFPRRSLFHYDDALYVAEVLTLNVQEVNSSTEG